MVKEGASTNQVGDAKKQVARVETPAAEPAAKRVFRDSTLEDMRKVSWSNLGSSRHQCALRKPTVKVGQKWNIY